MDAVTVGFIRRKEANTVVGMYKDDLGNVTLGVNHFGNLSK
jgi:hypothetical protein